MRRWNGWGEESYTYHVPQSAMDLLVQLLGPATPVASVGLGDVASQVPQSQLPEHRLLSTDVVERVYHARGQSFPDWVDLRAGTVNSFPDAVATPTSAAEVRELLSFAGAHGIKLIPYGGGTSVAGHINPNPDQRTLTVDLRRLRRLLHLDETSGLATFEAGVRGPDLEAQLRARGWTLGHFPQSFELSTLGGWVATRSSGQQSLGFGRIEDMFAGGTLESPAGTLELPCLPASAAGPDLRHVVLGSEGRMGIITEATVRVRRLPRREEFHALFFPTWEQGLAAARTIAQARIPLSMLRFSNAAETETLLALAGHARAIALLGKVVALRGAGDRPCMMLIGATGTADHIRYAKGAALEITRKHGGVHTGQTLGTRWAASRFRAPYLRNTLWELGYAVDTLETAVTWAQMPPAAAQIEAALREGLAGEGERVHCFTHLSHLYPSGGSLYTTYLFRLARDPQESLERWSKLKSAASAAIVANGGTISHQHGVGVDHKPYLAAEKGELGMATLRGLIRQFDPEALLNPGKLIDQEAIYVDQ